MNILAWLFGKKKPQNTLEYYPEAVMVVTASGELIYANDNLLGLFNLSADELFNMELLDLFDGGFNLIENLANSNDSAIVRSKLNLESDIYWEMRASHFEDNEQKIIITVRDVTQTHKMLNKLVFEHDYLNKVTKNKNTFLAKISGELTSPVHSINGFSQAILEGLGGDVNDKQEKYLKIINKNSTQLLELLNSIIEYSKLESGIYEYSLKNFDFVTLMTNLFEQYKPKDEEKKLVLNFNLNSLAKRTFFSDENLVKEVIAKLLDNALSNTDSGSIQLSVSHPDDELSELSGFKVLPEMPENAYLLLKITDTGLGVSKQDAETIFDPYMNIDKYIAKKSVSKCLYLGTVYNLVKLLKGKIWLESESMKGSTFFFIIHIEKLGL